MTADRHLDRALGLPGAVAMGLGSIIGTGIFVTIGTAAGVAGADVLIAVVLAALLATCNGLASAQLAAAHPVSGGAYEYGYRYLGRWPGRLAGLSFVVAKTASAATAAIGFAGYLRAVAGVDVPAFVVVAVTTLLVAGGIRRTYVANLVIVAITLGALGAFTLTGSHTVPALGTASPLSLAHATALVFVAYTGYGRIATLGEEVRDPARTIPRAIVITLAVTLAVYLAVTLTAVGSAGADVLATLTRETAAPLETIARPAIRPFIAIGAMTAMLGVLLNLVLGISRVVLAMARRGDAPRALAVVDAGSPRRAVIATGAVIAVLSLAGGVHLTWTLSACSVLVYYAVMNLCALRQPAGERRVPRAVPALGLIACGALAAVVIATL